MVNNQIGITMEQLSKIELNLKSDIQTMNYTTKGNAISIKNTPAFIRARRRSVGSVSIFKLLNYSSGGLNQSSLNESLTHKEQINSLNLKK